MTQAAAPTLPDGAAALIALARVAHRDGDMALESAARDKLAREYGLTLGFVCTAAVDRDMSRVPKGVSRGK